MGFRTVAIARGGDKADPARQLGAHDYIDNRAENVAERLTALGGAGRRRAAPGGAGRRWAVLATVINAKAIGAVVDGLGVGGKLLVVGVSLEPIEVSPFQLISQRRSIQGWPSGVAADSEDTLAFSALSGIRPMVETFPLERAVEAYERMMSGKAQFRVVIDMS